jgi:hypothetical protein
MINLDACVVFLIETHKKKKLETAVATVSSIVKHYDLAKFHSPSPVVVTSLYK